MGKEKIQIIRATLKQGDKTIFDLKGDEIKSFEIIKEKNVPPYWRKILDKNKDCIVHKQNFEDINKFIKNIPHTINDKEQVVSKCEMWASIVPPKPKSSQAHSVSKYKNNLKEYFESKKNKLNKFKELNLIVYICVYLSKKRFSTDVDNLAKPILDSLKPFFGDDKKVNTLIVEKKQLYDIYEQEDLDFLENSLIIIFDEKVRDDIIKI